MKLASNIRHRRLQWVDHVMRMYVERVPRKALEGYIEEKKPVGRPRGICLDAVDRNVGVKCRKWRMSEEDRDAWRRRMDDTEAQVGLQRHGRRRRKEEEDDEEISLNLKSTAE